MQKPLLDVEEVASRLHVTVRHIRRLVFELRIPFLKIGRLLRFDPEEVEGWLSTLRVDVRDSALRPSWDSARDHAHAVGRPSSSSTRVGPLEEAILMRSEGTRSELRWRARLAGGSSARFASSPRGDGKRGTPGPTVSRSGRRPRSRPRVTPVGGSTASERTWTADDRPFRRATLYTAWHAATKRLGMEGFHLHDLRHTGNTLAAATGASTKELMARMGHASARAALIYQHATRDRDVVIATALDGMIRDVLDRGSQH